MKKGWSILVAVLGLLGAFNVAFADPKVEEQDVGPVGQQGEIQYLVSPHGGHLATVTRKGSRMVVLLDGVTGPKFDEILGVFNKVASGPTLILPFTATVQVVFSDDGNHSAYVGRTADNWVVVEDGKELIHSPSTGYVAGHSGSVQLFMQFVGDHLWFGRTGFDGMTLWVDGQQLPIPYNSDPIVSPDKEHYVYPGVLDKKQRFVVDGKEAGYLGENPQFTADSKHLFSTTREGNASYLLVDGQKKIKADAFVKLYMTPVGDGFAVVLTRSNPYGQFVVFDGKKVDGTDCQNIPKVVISPDGQRFAAILQQSGNVQSVMVDGKKGEEYASIVQESLVFSADSKKLGYIARNANKEFVVIDGDESDGLGSGASFGFSPDGKHVGYCGSQGTMTSVFVDGKVERFEKGVYSTSFLPNVARFIFSPDGSRHAYMGENLCADGKSTGIYALNYTFSPDSKHLISYGVRPAVGNQTGLYVDDQLVYTALGGVRYRVVTPDSQHLFWMAQEPSTNQTARYQFVTYLDGKRVAAFDKGTVFGMIDGVASGPQPTTPPGWDLGPDGVLTCVGPVGDVMQRVKITPSSDTSITTLIADAQAAEANAKAAADAAKKPKKR